MKNINKTFKYMAMAAVALPMSLSLLTSCSEDENEEFLGRNEVKFTTAISGAIESRANVDYAPTDGNMTLYYDKLGSTQHATYAHAADGWECISTHPLYWDNFGEQTSYTFFAVAPSAEYGKVYADQSNVGDFVASDLLMARTTVDKVNTPVNLVLKHLMGKLVVNVLTIDGDNALTADELATIAVNISGLKTAYTVESGTTADIPAVATVSGDVSSHLTPNKASTAFSFIAPPQSTAGMELTFTVTIAGQKSTYSYKVSETSSPSLTAGTITTFNITISKTELALAGVTVTDWATGENHSASLAITTTGTAETPTGDTPVFNSMILWLADKVLTDFSSANSGTPLGISFGYTKGTDGTWSSDSPIYLDQMTAGSVIYATATNTDAEGNTIKDALTGYSDVLVAGAVSVKGGAVAIQFRHALAQMSVKLVKAENFTEDIIDAVITTPSMPKSASMNTDAEGYLYMAASGTETVTYDVTSESTHLVVPQTLAIGSTFIVKLKNGNSYTAKLAKEVVLEAGTNTTITLTLEETEVAVKAAVTPWGEAYATEMVHFAGVTTGGNDWTPEEEGELALAYVGAGTPYVAQYNYADGKWNSTAPLYWDEIGVNDYVKDAFAATFTPDDQPALFEKNILMGRGTTAAWGQDIALALNHVMAKFTVQIVEGVGIDDLDEEITGREIALQRSLSVEMGSDYKPLIGVDTDVTKSSFLDVDHFFVVPQALTDAHVITLTRPNGNKYTVKLSDLKTKDATPVDLFTDGKVEGGKHYVISLIVDETAVTAKATIIDWTDEAGESTIALPVTPGTHDLSAITGAGTLTLTYSADGTTLSTNPLHQAKMTLDAEGNWTSVNTLYWDEISQKGYTGKFGALFVPDSWMVGDDFLYGLATAEYGKNLALSLKHGNAKLKITLNAGNNVTEEELVDMTRKITYSLMDASCIPSVSGNGKANITLGAVAEHTFTDNTEITLPVQPLTDAHVITLTRSNGNKYILKLSDMKDANGNAIFPNGIEGGKKYSLVVTVNETALSVTATIQDWTSVNGSGNMTPDF